MNHPTRTTGYRFGAPFSAGLAFLAALASTTVQAQTPAPKSTDEEVLSLSPFQVTTGQDEGYLTQNTLAATGANTNLMKIPQTVQIINEQLIRDLGIGDDFTSALQIVVGGIDRRSYNPGDDFFMWGFRVSSTLKDGLPYFSNGLNLNYDVVRVEAIKGPSAMMYGQNSFVGGVLNWVTRKPTKTAKYSAEAVYGSNDYKRVALHASGPVTKTLRYRMDLGGMDSGGNGRKFSYSRNRFIGGEVEWDISKTALLNVTAAYQEENEFDDLTMIDPATGDIIAKGKDYTVSEPWSRRPKTTFRTTAKLTTTLGEKFTSRSVIGYSNWTNDWLRDQTNGLNVAAHTINKFTSMFSTSNHFVSIQQDFVKDFSTGPVNHRFTFGGDQRNELNRNNTTLFANNNAAFDYLNPVYGASVPNPALTPPAGFTNLKSRVRISGIYAQEQMTFWDDRIIALAGLRFNDQLTTSAAPAASGSSATLSEGSYTAPRYGIVFNPIESVSAYYNYGESFAFQSGVDTYGKQYVPSVGKVREIGAKLMFMQGPKGSISGSFAHIDMEVSNVRIVFTQGPNDPNPGASGNKAAGTQHNKGYQWSLNMNRNFEDVGSLNFLFNNYHGNIRNELGIRPAKVPNNTWGGVATFNFKKGMLNGFKVSTSAAFVGRQGGFTFPTTGAATTIPARTITNAMVGYKWKNYDFQLNVNNLSDKIYVVGAESALWIYADPGRVFKLSVNYHY
jgi:iron complex outermembrane receptor protein